MYFRVRGTAKIRCGIRETLTGYELELLSGKWESPNLNTDAWLGEKTKCGIATTLGMRDSREKRAGMPDFPTLYATKLFTVKPGTGVTQDSINFILFESCIR